MTKSTTISRRVRAAPAPPTRSLWQQLDDACMKLAAAEKRRTGLRAARARERKANIALQAAVNRIAKTRSVHTP